MKRLLALTLALCLLAVPCLAETLTRDDDLFGTVCWPDGTDEDTATFVYRYNYPHFEESGEVATAVNETFAYLIDDALGFTVPILAESLESTEVQAYCNVVSNVTCLNDDYLSVLVITESFQGATTTEVYSAQTFMLNGERAGIATSLPRLLGILDDQESDTWMQDRQTAKANELVWKLVWEIIEEQRTEGTVNYDTDLTYEMLTQEFYPEEDFYLDENGDPVFFIQSATIASAADGVLLFNFSLEELKDEL
jgi:hypothetical protein